MDLSEFWADNTKAGYATSRHRKTNSENAFDIVPEEMWLTKDDNLLSSRSKQRQSPVFGRQNEVFFTSMRNEAPVNRKSSSVMPTPRWLETLGEQFDQLDTERNGYINTTHMLHLLESMGQDCTMDDAER